MDVDVQINIYICIVCRYVCRVPDLTPTNQLFVKTGLLKLNDVFKLQVCKLMQNSMTGFYVEHKSFTLASSLHSHNIKFSKKFNFIIGTGLPLFESKVLP